MAVERMDIQSNIQTRACIAFLFFHFFGRLLSKTLKNGGTTIRKTNQIVLLIVYLQPAKQGGLKTDRTKRRSRTKVQKILAVIFSLVVVRIDMHAYIQGYKLCVIRQEMEYLPQRRERKLYGQIRLREILKTKRGDKKKSRNGILHREVTIFRGCGTMLQL